MIEAFDHLLRVVSVIMTYGPLVETTCIAKRLGGVTLNLFAPGLARFDHPTALQAVGVMVNLCLGDSPFVCGTCKKLPI
jgi:hypothetical protein